MPDVLIGMCVVLVILFCTAGAVGVYLVKIRAKSGSDNKPDKEAPFQRWQNVYGGKMGTSFWHVRWAARALAKDAYVDSKTGASGSINDVEADMYDVYSAPDAEITGDQSSSYASFNLSGNIAMAADLSMSRNISPPEALPADIRTAAFASVHENPLMRRHDNSLRQKQWSSRALAGDSKMTSSSSRGAEHDQSGHRHGDGWGRTLVTSAGGDTEADMYTLYSSVYPDECAQGRPTPSPTTH